MGDHTLEGPTWLVQELGGARTTAPRPELSFGDDGRLTGTTGVNRIMGDYAVVDGILRFRDVATTRMAGPPEAMEQEQRLLAVLSDDQAFVVTGDRLEIGDGETLALLVRPSTQPVTAGDTMETGAVEAGGQETGAVDGQAGDAGGGRPIVR